MSSSSAAIRVWDLPTRVFHWVLALTLVGSVLSAKIGGEMMVWHFRFGFTVFALILFRLTWGLVGGRWSRFLSFLPTPGRIARYLRGAPRAGEHLDVGHNPLGALSVLALLALLAVQVGTGLVADDEISNTGPLYRFVSGGTSLAATAWHKGWGQWGLLALIATHLAAIAFYRWRGQHLVGPMLSGDKLLPSGTPASTDSAATRTLALLLLGLCAATVYWVVGLGATGG